MSYSDDRPQVARLLRELAQALEESGSTRDCRNVPQLVDDARRTADELDLPIKRRSSRLVTF